jgi:tetratricopeptide (TPR) repeat protein
VDKAYILGEVAGVRAAHGDGAGAERVIRRALEALGTDRETRAQGFALEKIATAQMKLGHRDAARKTFAKAIAAIDEKNRRIVVWAQAKAGDIEGALETARRLTGGPRAQGLEFIAQVQATRGDYKGALATAQGIEYPEVRATALAQVASAQRAAGDLAGAAKTFAKAVQVAHTSVPGLFDQAIARPLYAVAYQQARSGDARTAWQWARREKSNFARARALLGVAEGMLDRQEAEGRKAI